MRRNKQQLACMRTLVEVYLNSNNNDPHLAYNDYISWHLLNNVKLPSHVQGIKDFIKLAKENQASYDYSIQLESKKQHEQKEEKDAKESILNLEIEQVKRAWKEAKEKGTDKERMAICDVYQHVANNMINTWKYNYNDIHILKQYNLI